MFTVRYDQADLHVAQPGTRRCVVLEVVGHPAQDVYVIASGFGGKAQWFRNIVVDPQVRVFIGSHAPAPATARVLTQPEADEALGAYISTHPRAWQRFKPVLELSLGSRISATDTTLPMVELRLG